MADYGLTEYGFKRKTYNDILSDMEAKAKELYGDNVNLSERSPLGMFLQVIAWEISIAWQELENSYYNRSALYATGTALDDIVNNFGRDRFYGTKSQKYVTINGDVGTLINAGFIVGTKDKILFKTTETVTIPASGEIDVDIQAIDIGENYNVPAETITEIINPTAGVRGVTNIEPTIGGTDIENDNLLRDRHLATLREPTTGDNTAQYKVWAREVKGVGRVKVLPTTPTKGYVTIIITDSNSQSANSELINDVFSHIDSVRPVNAGIYVESAIAKPININASVKLADGYNIQNLQNRFINSLEDYFASIALSETYVSFAQIGRLLLETKGIIDYENLTLNGTVANVALANTEVPTIGVIALGVI